MVRSIQDYLMYKMMIFTFKISKSILDYCKIQIEVWKYTFIIIWEDSTDLKKKSTENIFILGNTKHLV